MIDKKKYKEIRDELLNIKFKLENLEQLKKELNTQREFIQDNCEHDLILCYGEEKRKNKNSNIKIAKCLICNNYMELDDNFEIFVEKYILRDSIIDIIDKVNNINTYKGRDNLFVIRAKNKLEEIINSNNNISIDMIKKIIIDDLLEYDNELECKRLLKRNDN